MLFVTMLGYYLLLGLVFAIAFFFVGYKRILPDAQGSRIPVRLVWMPGAAAIWPLMAYKWIAGGGAS